MASQAVTIEQLLRSNEEKGIESSCVHNLQIIPLIYWMKKYPIMKERKNNSNIKIINCYQIYQVYKKKRII